MSRLPSSRLRGASLIAAIVLIALTAVRGHGGEEPALAHTAAPAAQQPFFDDFNGRDYWYADYYSGADLFPLDRSYSTAGATLEPGESATCGQGAGATVWIEYRADRSGTLHLAAEGEGFDALLAMYTWDMTGDFLPSPPGAKLQPVACAAEGTPNAGLSVAITANTQYLIQIGGQKGGSGNVHVTAACECSPPNDDFERLQDVYIDPYQPDSTRAVDTTLATLQAGEQQPCGNIGATVWYTVYAYNPTQIELTTAGSNFDTVIAIYGYPDYGWNPAALKPLRCVDDGADGSDQASLKLDAGEGSQYLIQVGGANGTGGALRFAARCVPTCPPYNDSMSNAEYYEPPVTGLTIPTGGATLEPGEPRPCGDVGKTVWYAIIVRGDARLAIDTIGSDFETVLAVYENVGFSPPPGSFDLFDCEAGGAAHLEFEANGNQTYWLQAGGADGASGQLVLNIDCVPTPCPPFNDSIVQPYYFWRPYGSESYTEYFETRGATTEDGEPLACGDMGHTAWWAMDVWAPQPTTRFVFDTRESDFDTAIAVYEGPLYAPDVYAGGSAPFGGLTEIACFDGAAGERVRATFTATPGSRYYVQIGGRDGQSGELAVTLSCDGPCPPENDNVGAAWYPALGYPTTTDTTSATLEPGEETPCGNIGRTVWYRLDGAPAAEFRVSTGDSEFATVIAVYEIAGVSPPGGVENVACVEGRELTFGAAEGRSYLLQIGGAGGAGGILTTRIDCISGACEPYAPPLPGQGGGTGGSFPGGAVVGPDTGSGGYLPGARR